ncbi:MAG: quinolinate synthase NadA [Bacteriovoracaceae bacterium]|nr:quinolinate synthase NadA [Bacteriovoracaceae bacterium]
MSKDRIIEQVWALKEELKDQVVILGHHYQRDDVIQFADYKGDSLQLAKIAASEKKPHIIFCGVHFMAETADMLSSENQSVYLPHLDAGCSMADMAARNQVDDAWEKIQAATKATVTPITYINCTADLKAFVGENGGSICTSSNAEKIISWALNRGEKLLFFPDQHLGRNTCYKLGVPLDEMVVYDPLLPNGGITAKEIEDARVILWQGYCCVHQDFHPEMMKEIKDKSPETITIVHPECYFESTQAADLAGSTSYIIDQVDKAPAGAKFAIGTESNLVNRLKGLYPDKEIISINQKEERLCRTMNLIHPVHILKVLESIKLGKPINVLKVDSDVTEKSLKALETMLAL